MSKRYLNGADLSDVSGVDVCSMYACTHCGCLVWDRELHDRVNGLDLVDTAEQAMKGTTPLAPPEPPA